MHLGRGVFDDEPRPKGRGAHVLGEPLGDVSVGELDERMAALRAEIERLKIAKRTKVAARDRAASVCESLSPASGRRAHVGWCRVPGTNTRSFDGRSSAPAGVDNDWRAVRRFPTAIFSGEAVAGRSRMALS